MSDSESTHNKRTALPAGFLQHPVHLFALGFGAGCVPVLPGTAGTLVGVLLYLPLQQVDRLIYLALVAVLFLAGIWICGATARDLKVHDHSAIVWDEIVGYLVTMALVPSGWMWILPGFILFRLFDIWKPWPIRLIDRRLGGGLGIMLDDVLAGMYSLACLILVIRVIQNPL
ncbi:MAG: phosphatidylglycerophosphatase [Gammaproteobacteria bacterium RBG_16_51_14]|nr:MAG: phosphatidylglycerophosphatase [Gammaproteobacteria bacterium RBG_16_51_14]